MRADRDYRDRQNIQMMKIGCKFQDTGALGCVLFLNVETFVRNSLLRNGK